MRQSGIIVRASEQVCSHFVAEPAQLNSRLHHITFLEIRPLSLQSEDPPS
jgi:hypothetical protein